MNISDVNKYFAAEKKKVKVIFGIFSALKKGEHIQDIVRASMDIFGVQYKVEHVLYKDGERDQEGNFVGTPSEKEMTIGYFDIKAFKVAGGIEQSRSMLQNYIYNKIEHMLVSEFATLGKDREYALGFKVINTTYGQLMRTFSSSMARTITKAYHSYTVRVINEFGTTFVKKGSKYYLIDNNYHYNKAKKNLFKEYKISSANKTFQNNVANLVKKSISKKIINTKNSINEQIGKIKEATKRKLTS